MDQITEAPTDLDEEEGGPVAVAVDMDAEDYFDAVVTSAVSSRARSHALRRERDERESREHDAAALASGCAPCIHAVEHGWWGDTAPARAHCGDCHRSWRSMNEGHCTRCHRQFHNTPAFDAHLTADGCRDPQTLDRQDGRPRFRLSPTAFGDVWRLVNYRQLPDFGALGSDD